MMTTIELARRVWAVRQAQKLNSRECTSKTLDESKRLERELDKLINEIIRDRPALLPMFAEDQEAAK